MAAAHQYVYHMHKLSKTYPGGKQVLKDISLSFLPGAKIGVVGLNGAGKSTLLKIMAGTADDFIGEARPADGIKVGYHNHSQEFYVDEGKALLEHLLENGSKFYLQLDCGWAMNAGMYPPYFIRKYKNRILSIHVKENDKVNGPGKRPASRYDEKPAYQAAFANAKALPLQERQKMLEQFNAFLEAGKDKMSNQCRMGAKESNLNWIEIKEALDEQDFEAFWIVEREGFYDEPDKYLREDAECCGST